MKRISTISLVALLGAALLNFPPATAATPHVTATETQEIAASYDHLTKEFYKKVDPQTVLNGVHRELTAALKYKKIAATLPVPRATGDEQIDERTIDLQVEKALNEAHGQINAETMAYVAISGIMDSVKDHYTVFLDPREYAGLNGDLDGGDFGGTGIVIQLDDGKRITVSNIVPDGPADKAGVQQDDLITAIDGASTAGWTLDRASAHLRGKEGTKVTLTLVRDGKLLPTPITITREKIHELSVYQRMLPGNIGYVILTVFGKDTSAQLRSAIAELQKKGARAYIMDLRENGGGYLTAAVDVSSQFIASGPIVSVEQRASNITTFDANDTAIAPVPLAVLVNDHTASASEITSGALQDSGVATIIGERTFGKGVVQTIFPLGDGSAVKITTARYLTPHNRDINHVGITPDIIAAENKGARIGIPARDAQLTRAVSFINQRLAALAAANGDTTNAPTDTPAKP